VTPTNEELFVSRANIAFRAGRPREGLALLQKALNLNPRNAHALRTLGALSEQDGDLPEAVSYYTQALASEPADAYALYFRSQVYATLHKFDDALKDADALVAIPPPEINRQGFLDGEGNRLDFHIIALRVRAGIYSAIGQSVRAEQDLSEAVAYNHSAQAFATRGKFLASKPGREREALADLDAAIGLNLIDPTLSYAKGLVLTRVKNFPDAISAFDQALRIYPQFAIALRMRARAYRELDQTDLAVADMEHAIAISPSMLRETIPALRLAGYWQSKDDPIAITPAFEDALRACMLDKQCN
jgi:tetratricopeptide (TPR) repeat protein